MSVDNQYTQIFNTLKDDITNSFLGGMENVYVVPDMYGSVQEAIDAAVANGHDQQDPAIISVIPDSTTGSSVTDVQFTENITVYDGIYLVSSVPNKRININGTLTLGSTALGVDSAGVTNTTLLYLLKDVHFIADGSGGALLDTSVNVVTRLDMVRVDFTNTGTATGDVCVTIDSTAVHTINMDKCVWTTAGNHATNYCLNIDGAAHVVTMNNRCDMRVTGAVTDNCVVLDDGATLTAYDSDFVGIIHVGDAVASVLNLTRCQVTGNVAAATGLIETGGVLAHILTVNYCKFIPNTHVNIFTIGNALNIVYGHNCSWDGSTTAITAINSANIAATSYWTGGPVVPSAAQPAGSVPYMLWANTVGGAVSADVP